MPWKTAMDALYDSGEFATVLDAALKKMDWNGFEARRKASAAKAAAAAFDGRIRAGVAGPGAPGHGWAMQ